MGDGELRHAKNFVQLCDLRLREVVEIGIPARSARSTAKAPSTAATASRSTSIGVGPKRFCPPFRTAQPPRGLLQALLLASTALSRSSDWRACICVTRRLSSIWCSRTRTLSLRLPTPALPALVPMLAANCSAVSVLSDRTSAFDCPTEPRTTIQWLEHFWRYHLLHGPPGSRTLTGSPPTVQSSRPR